MKKKIFLILLTVFSVFALSLAITNVSANEDYTLSSTDTTVNENTFTLTSWKGDIFIDYEKTLPEASGKQIYISIKYKTTDVSLFNLYVTEVDGTILSEPLLAVYDCENEGTWNRHAYDEYDEYKVVTVRTGTSLSAYSSLNQFKLEVVGTANSTSISILDVEITEDGKHHFELPAMPPKAGELFGSSANKGTFEVTEEGTVFTAPQSYGSDAYIRSEITGYDAKYSTLELDVTLSHQMDLWFGVSYDKITENTYKAGRQTILLDLASLATSDFRLQIRFDGSREETPYDEARVITFHSIKFVDKNADSGEGEGSGSEGDSTETEKPSFNFEPTGGNTTGENNKFTIGANSDYGQAKINVSNVNMSSVYVSIRFKTASTKKIDIYINGESSSNRLIYNAESVGGLDGKVTEFTKDGEYLTITCNLTSVLTGIESVDLVVFTFKSKAGDIIEITNFAITTDGVHNFDAGSSEGGEGETEQPKDEMQYTFNPDWAAEAVEGKTNSFKITPADSCGWVLSQVSNVDLTKNVYVSVKFKSETIKNLKMQAYDTASGAYTTVASDVANSTSADVNYKVYGDNEFIIVTVNITSLVQNFGELSYFKIGFFGSAGDEFTLLNFAFTEDGEHDFDTTVSGGSEGGEGSEPEIPEVKLPSINKFVGSSALKGTFEPKEDGTTVYRTTASYGSAYIRTTFNDYDVTKYPVIAINLTISHDMNLYFDYGYTKLRQADYKAGTHTIYLDLSKIEYESGKNFQISHDKDRVAGNYDSERTITFNSVTFLTEMPKVEYDSTQPTVVAPFTGSSYTITTNEQGEQVISYGTDKGAWTTIKTSVTNYNPKATVLEFTYTSKNPVKLCFSVAGDYDTALGHKLYPAGTYTVTLDLSDKSVYKNLDVDFNIEIYVDGNADPITAANELTIHSLTFAEPKAGMHFGDAKGHGIAVEKVGDTDNVYNFSYTLPQNWNSVTIPVKNYETKYDVLKLKLNVPENTNFGIWVYYLDENDAEQHVQIRNHGSLEGVVTTAGDYDAIYYLAAYGLDGKNITKIEFWLDPPVEGVTTNTGDVVVKLLSMELVEIASLEIEELEFSVEDVEITFGEAYEVEVNCDKDVTLLVQYQKVGDDEWHASKPWLAGEYTIRVTYVGSFDYKYKVVEAKLVINKATYVISSEDELVSVDEFTKEVTLAEGVEASTSETFEEGYEVLTGSTVEYGTTIYYRLAADENHFASDALSVEFVKTVAVYRKEAIDELNVYVNEENYQAEEVAEIQDIIAAATDKINAALDAEEVAAELQAAKDLLDEVETSVERTLRETKEAAASELDSYISMDDYHADEQAEIEEIILEAKENIASAEDVEAVAALLVNAKAEIDEVETLAKRTLRETKEAAQATLAGYAKAEDYRAEEQELLAQYIATGKVAIESADTVEKVETELKAATDLIDALTTEAEHVLAETKAEAQAALESYVNANDYRTEEQELLAQYIADGNEAIAAAETLEEVASELVKAQDLIDALLTDAQRTLAEEKETALNTLNNYDADDYRTEEQELLAQYKATYAEKINKATSVSDVRAELKAAQEAIDALTTDAEYTAQELADKKALAQKELESYKSLDDYRSKEQQELKNAIATGKEAIEKAETIESVEQAVIDAKKAIDGIKTKQQWEAEEAADAQLKLTNAKNAAKEELDMFRTADLYLDDEAAELNEIIVNTKAQIEVAESVESVEALLAGAKESINKLPLAAEYEIANYAKAEDYRAEEQVELAAIIKASQENIRKAETAFDIANELKAAKVLIDALKTKSQYELEEAIANAKSDLAGYAKAEDYRKAEQERLAIIVSDGTKAIDASDTVAKVTEELNKAKAAIDLLTTIAQYELAEAKEAAKAALAKYVKAEDYRTEEAASLATIIENGNKAIDEADSIENVEKALKAAKDLIDALETNAELTLKEAIADAKSDLAGYAKAEDYRAEEAEQLATIIENGNKAIEEAETVAKVTEALKAATDLIDALKLKATYELEEAIADAVSELEGYAKAEDYRAEEAAELADIIADGKEAIKAADTVEKVEIELAAALELIDALKLKATYELEEAIADAKSELAGYAKAEDYREAEQEELEEEIAKGIEAIDAADSVEKVTKALNDAKAAIDAIKTNAEYEAEEEAAAQKALLDKQAEAKQALTGYKSVDLYREEEQASLAQIIKDGNAAIDSAETIEEVDAELNAAKELIDALKLKSAYEAEELKAAQDSAKEELAGYAKAEDYREEEAAELAKLIKAANAAIDVATSASDVNLVVEGTKAKIDKLVTNAEHEENELAEAKLDAKAALATYKKAADYREEEQASLTKAIEAGNKAIDEATTIEAVAKALAAAKKSLDAIPTNQERTLEETKKAARIELFDYKSFAEYRSAEQTLLSEAINEGRLAISAATTVEEVANELAKAKAVIDAIKTSAQYEAEELTAAKSQAIAAVAAEIGTYSIDKSAYEAAINAAETVEAVNQALANAKSDIAAKKVAIDTQNAPAPEKKGCGGSVIPSILGLIILLGACLTLRKKYNN